LKFATGELALLFDTSFSTFSRTYLLERLLGLS
jgi:hypothetical protein